MNNEIKKQFYCKAKNKRIFIELVYFKEENSYLFKISTRTLEDRKTRKILKIENWYRPETFFLLNDLMTDFIDAKVQAIVYPERYKCDVSVYDILNKK